MLLLEVLMSVMKWYSTHPIGGYCILQHSSENFWKNEHYWNIHTQKLKNNPKNSSWFLKGVQFCLIFYIVGPVNDWLNCWRSDWLLDRQTDRNFSLLLRGGDLLVLNLRSSRFKLMKTYRPQPPTQCALNRTI